jgi:GDPmannose 4,6-dehydratase
MKALITGITGQDGSYLAELLLSKGYEVHGIMRKASTFNTHRIDHIYLDSHNSNARLHLYYGDLTTPNVITNIIWKVKPDEIYHLGAQSHVRTSFDMPEYTGNVTGLGTTRILEAIRKNGIDCKFYQASSSEMFGSNPPPQSEKTTFRPRSPYAIAKVYAYWMTVNYREAYDMYACNGVLFNHESPRRGETFVTRKVTRAVANILARNQRKIYLGNLDAKRDWGFAPEYVEAMWLMLQQNKPTDLVIGTGRDHSVRELVNKCFNYVGIHLEWQGQGVKEKGIIKSFDKSSLLSGSNLKKGDVVIEIDPRYFRPTEVNDLRADSSKAKKQLKWEPRTTFEELVKIMIDYDMKLVELDPIGEGMQISKDKGFEYTNHDYSFYERVKE